MQGEVCAFQCLRACRPGGGGVVSSCGMGKGCASLLQGRVISRRLAPRSNHIHLSLFLYSPCPPATCPQEKTLKKNQENPRKITLKIATQHFLGLITFKSYSTLPAQCPPAIFHLPTFCLVGLIGKSSSAVTRSGLFPNN